MEFKKPLYVSTGIEIDQVEIQFESEWLFVDQYGQKLQESTAKLTKTLPQMYADPASEQTIESAQSLLGSSTKSVLVANTILQLLQGASL